MKHSPGFARERKLALRSAFARWLSLCAACLFLVQTAHVRHAFAQEAETTEPAAYRETVREALQEYRARNFPEARALFAEAHALYPNARTLRGLGMTAFELRSYRECIGYLNDALASTVKPLDAGLRAETERLIARAERFVGKLSLTITPADAEVTVDGNPIVHGEHIDLVLEVGEHTLTFAREGYHDETRSLYVKGRETETWQVVLPALPAPVQAAPVAAVPAPEEVAREAESPTGPRFYNLNAHEHEEKKPLYKNPWLWTGVGAAVVAAIVIGVTVGHKTEIGRTQVGDQTPQGGVFNALRGTP